VTGATGSGKSTTLAAMIQKINQEKPAHIITIEDPIEFQFSDVRSMINQREVGIDTPSFSHALRSALRQNPDVILVGELRDRETVETAVNAAETGHLVMSTLHTNDAVESLTRVMSFFPPHQHQALAAMLGSTLRAIVSQRLVSRVNRQGLVAANEILIANNTVREVILKRENFNEIKDAIAEGSHGYGMQSFDQALFSLFKRGIISKEEAVAQASRKDDMRLLLSGIAS